jgi:hypothetical protein
VKLRLDGGLPFVTIERTAKVRALALLSVRSGKRLLVGARAA